MAVELTTETLEQTRARYPDESGYIERDGVWPRPRREPGRWPVPRADAGWRTEDLPPLALPACLSTLEIKP